MKEVAAAIQSNNYEVMEDGKIFIPRTNVIIGGIFTVDHYREGDLLSSDSSHNIMVNEGLNHVLSVLVAGTTQIDPWYVALFEGNYTPIAGDSASDIASNSTETTAYDESVRQTYVEGTASGQSIDNSASKASFTMNATKTIYGGFLASINTKSGTTGTLLCASRFDASKSVVATDVLDIQYTLSASDA